MRLVKFGHACVRVEEAAAALVIDPGTFTEPEAVDGVQAVLVTHAHPDHLDADRLRRADAPVFTNAEVAAAIAEQAPELSDRVTVVSEGETFTAAGQPVSVHGERHAVVHPDIPTVANTAFLVSGTVFHPGDSFTAPPQQVETLLVPVSGPWLRLSQTVDFARAYAGSRAMAIHDGLLNANGLAVVDRTLDALLSPRGIEYVRVDSGTQL
jgi:L-ascorbate metabolism protein UlaG (beta-lactamase superfamily)